MKYPTVHKLMLEENRLKICCFIDKYVTKFYGSRHITSWVAKNKNKTIFDLITMSNLAYSVAVIENKHEIWDQIAEEAESQDSSVEEGMMALRELREGGTPPKKTPKFTKKAGKKREFNMSGWTQEGIVLYKKVWDRWKSLSQENKDGCWEKLKAEWIVYVKDYKWTNCYCTNRKRKRNDRVCPENMPALPLMDLFEIMLDGDDDFEPDCPWKMYGNLNKESISSRNNSNRVSMEY